MLKYDRIDISDRIDVNKTDRSKECMFCHYWCFLYKTLVMVHLVVMVVMIWCKDQQIFKILLLLILKSEYRIYFQHKSKHKATKIMNKFDLVDKMGNIYCND